MLTGQRKVSPLDVRRTIAITRTWFPLLVVSVVLAAGAAYLVSGVLPKVYEAKSTLIVGQSLSTVNPDYSQLLVSQRLSATYAAVATTRPIRTPSSSSSISARRLMSSRSVSAPPRRLTAHS